MGSFLSVIPIVARRVTANARLLLAVVIGAILASALMSTTSIYTDAIRDLGLTYAVRQRGLDKINIIVASTSRPTVESQYREDQQTVEEAVERTIKPIVSGPVTTLLRSETFFPTAPGEAVSKDEGRRRGNFQVMTNLGPHVKVEGKTPADAVYTPGSQFQVETLIGGDTARRLGINIGDSFDLHPFRDPTREPVRVAVVGIIDPKDEFDVFWFGAKDVFDFPSEDWDTLLFFVTEKSYFGGLAAYLPAMNTDYYRFIYLRPEKMNARNADAVRASVLSLTENVGASVERTSVSTDLPDVLSTFDEKLFFTRIPLLVLVLQIAAIVMYYLFMVSTMLVERQAAEIALFKSRGATTAQVMQVYVIEGLVILGIGLLAGPPLAALVVSLLGQTPPFTDLSGGTNLQVRLSLDAYAWAAAGAVLALVMLLWPAYGATRRTMVQQRTASARPPKQPLLTRYYLDLVLVGIGAVLFYQLDRSGTLVTERLSGEQTVDPVTLLTPAFFILTVGIFFLRLFPIALRLLAWFVARLQGTSILIGMWQLVRNPVHYSRLVLLLMLATAVGMFTASFGATLEKSYSDRAAYEAGGGLKVGDIQKATTTSGPLTMAEELKEQLEAKAATPLLRTTASEAGTTQRFGFDILGIDPATFAEVAFFRDDFADTPLPDLLAKLSGGAAPAKEVQIPAGSRWVGLWVNPISLQGLSGFDMRVRDATGRYYAYNLGPDYFGPGAASQPRLRPGWNFVVADLKAPLGSPRSGFPTFGQFFFNPTTNIEFKQAEPVEPLTLVSLSIRFMDAQSRVSLQTGSVFVDDLLATSEETLPGSLATDRLLFDAERKTEPFANAQVVTDFNPEAFEPLHGILPVKLADALNSLSAGGHTVTQLEWRSILTSPPAIPSTHGLRPKQAEGPVPVLISEGYVKQRNFKAGDKFVVGVGQTYFEVEVVDTFKLFPTLKDPREAASMIVDVNRLLAVLNGNPRAPVTYADEVWLEDTKASLARARELGDAGKLAASFVSFDELRTAQKKDPLVAAGWEGILFISFAAILILSAIGFLIYSYLTAQRRTLEFAVLRTMGLSKGQIAIVVGFEQLFIISLGMIAGTLMGLRLGALMIRYMGLTETGDEVLPPLSLHVSWLTVGSAWVILGFVFLVTIGVVVLLYSRLALHRVLRIGEA